MLDARRADSVLRDTRAVEIVEAIDYDFAKFRGPSLAGSVLRSSIFDQYVRDFLAEHPDGTIVELGTGLNTRFDRLDNGRVRWFDLDLPDTMALRRRFFADTDRYTMLDGSILATDWYDRVRAGAGPVFLVSEAVLLYFERAEVHTALGRLAAGFPVTKIAFDTGAGR
jgi:O-methyltransferase involved in polyketide biosynthesis